MRRWTGDVSASRGGCVCVLSALCLGWKRGEDRWKMRCSCFLATAGWMSELFSRRSCDVVV